MQTKKIGCFLISMIMLVTVFGCLYLLTWSYIFYEIIVFCFGNLIFWISPVENQNKRLDKVEKRVYRNRTRWILILESFLFVLALLFDLRELVCVVAMTFVLTGISLILGLIKYNILPY